MKYKTIHLFTFFIFIFSVGISTGKAYAMPYSSTVENSPVFIATPYPTLTPIVLTPTQIPLNANADFTCPLGVPYGYGTVTPSTEWDIACGHCLPTATPAVLSTSTAGPTHTPWAGGGTALPPICITVPAGGEECYIPTVTPASTNTPFVTATPNVTVTPSGSNVLECYDANCEQLSPTAVRISKSGSVSLSVYSYDFPQLKFTRPVNQNLYVYFRDVSFSHQHINSGATGTTKVTYNYRLDAGLTNRHNYLAFDSGFQSFGYFASVDIADYDFQSSTADTSPTLMSLYPRFSQGGNLTGKYFDIDYSYEIYVSTVPFTFTTPTPSPTPIGGNFCDAVSNSTVQNQFNLGGTGGVTSQQCYVFPGIYYQDLVDALLPSWLSPFSMVFNSLFPSSAGIDPLTFCVRQRDYTLYIFGYRLPYEALLGLGVFLASLRMFNPAAFSGVASLGTTKHGESSPTSTSVTRGADGSITFTKRFRDKDKS